LKDYIRLNFSSVTLNWTQLNADPELWSYRIIKASNDEVNELLGDDKCLNQKSSDDQWIVDIEINIKKLVHICECYLIWLVTKI